MLKLINGNKTYATALMLIAFGVAYYFAPQGVASWSSPAGEIEGAVRNVVGVLMVGLGVAVAALRHGMKTSEKAIIAAINKT